MRTVHLTVLALLAFGLVGVTAPPDAAAKPDAGKREIGKSRAHGGIYRQPDVSASHVVFVYGDDLWTVPREGGTAVPLASPEGVETFPRFSPDGKRIAFVAAYDGSAEIYVLPAEGGVPERVTWHPGTEYLCDWTADGRLLFSMGGLGGLRRHPQLFTVAPEGGLPERLPVPYGMYGSLDRQGTRLAYILNGGARQNWKRYRGGQAADVWVVDLEERTSKRLTDWEGNDTEPMWFGDRVYFLSDAGAAHRMNVWVHDLKTGKRRQVTRFADADVRSPAMGPGPHGDGEIVFQEGTGLHLLDLQTEQVRPVDVSIPGARPDLRPQRIDASGQIQTWQISPTGKRTVVEARGDVWTLPARKGSPRNLTRTSSVAERDPAWSPDGKWIAYFSDGTGEYELYVTRADGKGGTKKLTSDGKAFRFKPTWAPDSKRIAFTDKTAALHVHDLETGKTVRVDRDPLVESDGMERPSWSHDGRWLAYARAGDTARNHSIHLWNRETGQTRQVTSDLFYDHAPAFGREGKLLFFASSRSWSPRYADHDGTFIYGATEMLLAVPLTEDEPSPFAPRSDEESFEEEDDEDEEEEHEDDEEESAQDASAEDDGLSGTWVGLARNDELLPPGGLSFTLTILLDENGTVTGSLSLRVGVAAITAGRYDADSGTLTLDLEDEDGNLWKTEAEVTGSKVTGTATLVGMGLVVEFEGRRRDKRRPEARGDAASGTKKSGDRQGKNKGDKVEIDLDGFEGRAVALPTKPGRFRSLAVNHKGALLYVRSPVQGAGGESEIQMFVFGGDKPKEETVASGAGSYRLSADGKQMLVLRGDSATLQKAGTGSGKPVSKDGLTTWIRPREEWRQLVTDAWRIMRDYFYDPHMHGVDWPAVKERSLAMVEACVTRDDVSYVIREMIGELNVGHANHWIGAPWRRRGGSTTGMLGVDWKRENGAYRIGRIVTGAPWDVDARGPLAAPGLDVRAGDYVLAVNGVPVDASEAPWAVFEGLAGKTITLTVSEKPVLDDDAREVLVKTARSESRLRYRAWVESKRAYVEEKTNGRVGYVYVPDTGWNGQNELMRQYQGQLAKDALIVDERWNGGGQIPTRFVEMLNRPITNYWARRDGLDWPWPYSAHQGPKCMLMNGNSGSGGDAFPHYFRQQGLGKLIGTRTWGGLVGMSGNPGLIDGSYVSIPTFAFYERDGTWGIEGHGVDPDLEVIDDPALMFDGGDPQLDAAIDVMLEELKTKTYAPPKRPAYPDRSGMGIAPEDK